MPKPRRPSAKEAASNFTDSRINRHQRRHASSLLAKGKTGPTSRETAEASADEFMRLYPFLVADRYRIVAYFRGTVGWSEMRVAIQNGLRNIGGLADWLVDNWEHGAKFVQILRPQVIPFHAAMLAFRSEMKEIIEQSRGALTDEEMSRILGQAKREQWEKTLTSIPNRLAMKILDIPEPCLSLRFSEALTPSTLFGFEFLFEVLLKSAVLNHQRKPVESDFADGMHAIFAPRVDVFRADRFACDILEQLPLAGATKFVPSLADLPAVISNIIRTRMWMEPMIWVDEWSMR